MSSIAIDGRMCNVNVCVCVGGLKVTWCASVDHLFSVPHSRVFIEKLTVT